MLSKEQTSAVKSPHKHTWVQAGAGSGKTKVIVSRAIKLIQDGIDPTKIVIITYTNASASEIIERIKSETEAVGWFVGTMNSYAMHCITSSIDTPDWDLFNKKGWACNAPDLWNIVDDSEVNDLIKEVKKDLPKSTTLKSLRLGLNSSISSPASTLKENRARACRVLLRSKNMLMQDDLVSMLVDGAECLPIEHLIVDECQDLSHLHKRFLDAVSVFADVFVCGDDAQAIFSFLNKGQEAKGFESYTYEHFQPVHYVLSKNFRSSSCIVDLANKVRSNLYEAGACSHLTQNPSAKAPAGSIETWAVNVNCSSSFEESLEQEFLQSVAFEFMASESCALIARTWKDVQLFKPYLTNFGVIEQGDESLSLKLPANRAVLAMAKVIYSGQMTSRNLSDLSFMGSTAKPDSYLKKLSATADLIDCVYKQEMTKPLTVVADEFVGQSFWDQAIKIKTIDNLIDCWHGAGGTPSPLLNHFVGSDLKDLIVGSDRIGRESKGSKICTTIHGAKGLEYDTVILYGISDGIFPSSRDKTEELIQEAGRCLYTAITRAKSRLVMIQPIRMRNKERKISPFMEKHITL